MSISARIRSYRSLIAHLVQKPATVRESFGFIAASSRGLPRRDETKCTGCGACNERCSSGATSITDHEQERTVSIDSLRCIFCARCADVCPEGALDLTFRSCMEAEDLQDACIRMEGEGTSDHDLEIGESRRYAHMISLSHLRQEKQVTVDTTLPLQICRVCGDMMPVTEKQLAVITERVLANLQPEQAAIVREDMKVYLTSCISCRRKMSLAWNTHPRKFI